jgi:undecaprenyl-phosphate galactose phosphotransferase
LTAALTLFLLRFFNAYKYATGIFEQSVSILKSAFFSFLFLIVLLFFFKSPQINQNIRTQLIAFLFCSVFLLILNRFWVKNFFYGSSRFLKRRVLLIGAGKAGKRLIKEMQKLNSSFFEIVGFVDDYKKESEFGDNIPILGKISELGRVINEHDVDEIFISINSIKHEKLLALIDYVKQFGKQINLSSRHFHIIKEKTDNVEYDGFYYVPIYSNITKGYINIWKRLMDLMIASILLFLLSPLLILIGLIIKFTSKGPVLYKSNVIGKGGETFVWYKFRSMRIEMGDNIHKKHLEKIIKNNYSTKKITDDPRVTWIGKFIRKYSFDELPQLFNVIKGEMSLVGPRPCLPYEFELMNEWHKKRTAVLPGITGLWQIYGRNREDVTFNDSMILDLYYVYNISFWLDIKIILKTIPVVLFGKGGS